MNEELKKLSKYLTRENLFKSIEGENKLMTSIRISNKTKEELNKIKTLGKSYDNKLGLLMDELKDLRKCKEQYEKFTIESNKIK